MSRQVLLQFDYKAFITKQQDTHAKKIRQLRGEFYAYFINTNVDAKTSQVFPMTHIHTGIDQGVESTP